MEEARLALYVTATAHFRLQGVKKAFRDRPVEQNPGLPILC